MSTKKLYSLRDWFQRIHVITGLAAALFLLLIATTGMLINHQESLGLLDVEVNDKYLPSYYRADVRTGATRLNIIITDLHSGRILGARGNLFGDLMGVLLLISAFSGTVSYFTKQRLLQRSQQKRPECSPATEDESMAVANSRGEARSPLM